ncbi:cell wall protein PRY3-like isoform X2 [Mizuhopecten yessoensis]|uniref:cell wall protein PRY3-like isoform X2 n=1 Tax=Mizuhopecten yessoensis TaxID=6573 RepID=UPI000B457CD9|nr:cell wall protein PRY3-like isoform X2 [Mizuhopecten yessoensis]
MTKLEINIKCWRCQYGGSDNAGSITKCHTLGQHLLSTAFINSPKMVQSNLSLPAVIAAVAVAMMFVSLSCAASSTTEASSSTGSTVTSESTTSASSTTDSGSTQSSVSAGSTTDSTTTTAAATTMASYTTCYTGSCDGASCLNNISGKCNTTMYCKLDKMVNSTSTSYDLSCANSTCTTSTSVYCCKTSDCNKDETKLNSNGSGHPTCFGMMNILAIIVATILVTRQVVCVGE